MPSQCFQTGFFVQSELISNYKPKPNPRFGTFSSLCLVINRGSDILPALTSRWQFESCWARGGKFLASAGTGYPSQPLCMRPPVDKEAHPPTAERTYPQTQTTGLLPHRGAGIHSRINKALCLDCDAGIYAPSACVHFAHCAAAVGCSAHLPVGPSISPLRPSFLASDSGAPSSFMTWICTQAPGSITAPSCSSIAHQPA